MTEPIPIHLPDLQPGETPIRIGTWLVEKGEPVLEGDRIVELRLPGMTYDVSTSTSGIIVEITKRAGNEVYTGDVLAWVQVTESLQNDLPGS